MGKKGTKRKTQWRTLSITECPQQHSKNGITKKLLLDSDSNQTSTETNVDEAISQDDDCSNHKSFSTSANHLPSYLKRKSSTSSNFRSDYRNHNNSSHSYYNKHNSTSSTSSLYSSSRYSYRRRPFSLSQSNGHSNNTTSRYSNYGVERASNRGHRTTSENRDAKPIFNEDEYTRISTPRQDVIFKKGYFSQPKKYMSSTDTNTTSSAAASIVSAEESISAQSVPSLSPEQCSSIADSLDPEQGFMYSIIDPNGVVYSYMPNGFDQYGGQMMLMPYGYPPYLCSPDIISPVDSNEESEQNRTSVESHEIPSSDLNETKVINEVPDDASSSSATKSMEDKKEKESDVVTDTDQSDNNESNVVKVSSENDEAIEKTKEDEENPESTEHIPEQFYGYGSYQPYYPPVIYPYMFPQQFVPVYGSECDAPNEKSDKDENRIRYHKNRKTRHDTDGNSTGVSATTTDYSEDETDEQESPVTENAALSEQPDETSQESSLQIIETEPKQTTLNVNVKEFIPRGLIESSLNVNVKEFLPRNNRNSPRPRPNDSKKKTSKFNQTESKVAEHATNMPAIKPIRIEQRVKESEKKPTELTLAEKIKQRLAEESKIGQQKKQQPIAPRPQPQRRKNQAPIKGDTPNNRTNNVKKRLPQPEIRTQPSYAQIANRNRTESSSFKSPPKDSIMNTTVINLENLEKLDVDGVKPLQITKDSTTLISHVEEVKSEDSTPKSKDTWQTVKARGKRGKHTKETSHEESFNWDESPEESIEVIEEIIIVKEETVKNIENLSAEIPENISEQTVISPEEPPPCLASEIETLIEEPTTVSVAKKRSIKSKNRKSTRKSTDTKKKKKIELIDSEFILSERVQPELDSSVVKDDKEEDEEEANQITPTASEPDLTFDHLYLGKGFGRSPIDIIKGFDYKFKSKSILKEEEEMVLNVIKSLNNSGVSSPPKISPSPSVTDEDDEKTIVEECDSKMDTHDSGSETDTISDTATVVDGKEKESLEDAKIELIVESKQEITPEIREQVLEENSLPSLIEFSEPQEEHEERLEENKNDGKISDIGEQKLEDLEDGRSVAFKVVTSDQIVPANETIYESENFAQTELPSKKEDIAEEDTPIKENTDSVTDSEECSSLSSENSPRNSINMSSYDEALVEDFLIESSEDASNIVPNEKETIPTTENTSVNMTMQNVNGIHEIKPTNSEESSKFCNGFTKDKTSCSPLASERELTPESRQKALTELNNIQIPSPAPNLLNGNSSDDYHSCISILSNLIKTNTPPNTPEPSAIATMQEWNFVADNQRSDEEINLKNTKSAANYAEQNGFAKRMENGVIRKDPNSEQFTEEIIKETQRILNTSISCDRSSGIGSDCEDNQNDLTRSDLRPTNEPNRTVDAMGSEQIAQSDHCTIKSSSLFPLSTANFDEPLSFAAKTMPKTSITPTNVLPIYSQSNSTSCDNQSVSYTSSNSIDKISNSTSRSQPIESTIEKDSTKFPHQTVTSPDRFPLTEAVKQWLVKESKEPTPEPILRAPDDPELKSFLKQRIVSNTNEDWSTTEAESDDNDADDDHDCIHPVDDQNKTTNTKPKNLKGNPLHVSSCNSLITTSINNDSDSDYNSDSNEQLRYEDDSTCKRVAELTSDTQNLTAQSDRFDLLEYWDDEFIRNPRKWLTSTSTTATKSTFDLSRGSSIARDSTPSSTEISSPGPFEPYDSVYGKTIDYDRLMANNFEFLSNNIISFNDDKSTAVSEIRTSAKTEHTKFTDTETLLANCKKNFDKADSHSNETAAKTSTTTTTTTTTNTNSSYPNNNENCIRPPKVCCVVM